MPINGGFVGMVDREEFDEWLRQRAAQSGATRRIGQYQKITRDADGVATVHYRPKDGGAKTRWCARGSSSAPTARSPLSAGRKSPAPTRRDSSSPIMRSFAALHAEAEAKRCEIHYRGTLSPDFYAWIFPHGDTMSVGTGSAQKGFSLKSSVRDLRALTGLGDVPRPFVAKARQFR